MNGKKLYEIFFASHDICLMNEPNFDTYRK